MEGSFNFSPHSPLQPLPHPLAELPQPLPPPAPNGSTAKKSQEIVFRVKELIEQPTHRLGAGPLSGINSHRGCL
jgi:hypothetical protein